MLFFLRKLMAHPHHRSPVMGSALFFNGLLCVCFGLAILAAPELLAYFVAGLLLLFGGMLLMMWWRVRQGKNRVYSGSSDFRNM